MSHLDQWMALIDGTKFFFKKPYVHLQHIEVATLLSRINRFGGHTLWEYSVAQHSVLVYKYLDFCGYGENVCAWGLLHDLNEIYLGDVIYPLKDYLRCEAFNKLEAEVNQSIMKSYNISLTEEELGIVKKFDLTTLATEVRDLMDPSFAEEWKLEYQPWDAKIVPWSKEYARDQFNGCLCKVVPF